MAESNNLFGGQLFGGFGDLGKMMKPPSASDSTLADATPPATPATPATPSTGAAATPAMPATPTPPMSPLAHPAPARNNEGLNSGNWLSHLQSNPMWQHIPANIQQMLTSLFQQHQGGAGMRPPMPPTAQAGEVQRPLPFSSQAAPQSTSPAV